jgi:hypothetical protein
VLDQHPQLLSGRFGCCPAVAWEMVLAALLHCWNSNPVRIACTGRLCGMGLNTCFTVVCQCSTECRTCRDVGWRRNLTFHPPCVAFLGLSKPECWLSPVLCMVSCTSSHVPSSALVGNVMQFQASTRHHT